MMIAFFCLELVFVGLCDVCPMQCMCGGAQVVVLISFHDIHGPGSQTWLQYFN